MVFWSSWAKKVRESINKLTFDKLKSRVDFIENDYATKTYTDAQDTALSNRITANTNRVVRIETELGNANFVLYMGPWSATSTYKKGLAVTEGDLWYVSNVDNNINHRPSGVSDQYWKLITSPSINLNDYYTKSQADSRYAFKGDISNLQGQINNVNTNISNNYYTKTQSDQNYTSFATGLQLRNDVSSNTTAINAQASILGRKADLSYVDNNFYNKTWINARRIKFKDIKITNTPILEPLTGGKTWKLSIETNFEFPSYNFFLDNMDFYNIRFLNAQYTNWKYKITAAYSVNKNGRDYLGMVIIVTQPNTYTTNSGSIVRIWYSEEINR